MKNDDNLHRARAMLETVESTGYKAQLNHPTEPNTVNGIIDIDAAVLRVLIAHYSMPERDPRPAWLDPEPFDTPAPVLRPPEEMRE